MACNLFRLRRKKPTAKSSPFEIYFGVTQGLQEIPIEGVSVRKLIFKTSNVNNKHVVLSLFCRTAIISSVQFQRQYIRSIVKYAQISSRHRSIVVTKYASVLSDLR